jgi:hypothetical protein
LRENVMPVTSAVLGKFVVFSPTWWLTSLGEFK